MDPEDVPEDRSVATSHASSFRASKDEARMRASQKVKAKRAQKKAVRAEAREAAQTQETVEEDNDDGAGVNGGGLANEGSNDENQSPREDEQEGEGEDEDEDVIRQRRPQTDIVMQPVGDDTNGLVVAAEDIRGVGGKAAVKLPPIDTEYRHKGAPQEAVWVQKPHSMAFKKTVPGDGKAARPMEVFHQLQSSTKTVIDFVAQSVATIFMFVQGTLGGFSLLNLLFFYVGKTDAEFLRFYSPLANTVSTIYFLLGTVALLAAVDKYAKDRMAYFYDVWYKQYLDLFIILLYLLAYIFSLANIPMDELIHFANQRVPGWYEGPGIDPDFSSKLGTWHAFNLVRIICCSLAWMLLAVEVRPYEINASNRDLALRNPRTGRVGQMPDALSSPDRNGTTARTITGSPITPPQRTQVSA